MCTEATYGRRTFRRHKRTRTSHYYRSYYARCGQVGMVSFSLLHAILFMHCLLRHRTLSPAFVVDHKPHRPFSNFAHMQMCVVLRLGDNRTNNRTQCCSMSQMFGAAPKSHIKPAVWQREPKAKPRRGQQPTENGYFIIYAIEWQTMLVSGIKHQNQK